MVAGSAEPRRYLDKASYALVVTLEAPERDRSASPSSRDGPSHDRREDTYRNRDRSHSSKMSRQSPPFVTMLFLFPLALALSSVGAGRPDPTEAAQAAGMNRQTLRGWVDRYDEARLAPDEPAAPVAAGAS